jgi:hypothetical protein
VTGTGKGPAILAGVLLLAAAGLGTAVVVQHRTITDLRREVDTLSFRLQRLEARRPGVGTAPSARPKGGPTPATVSSSARPASSGSGLLRAIAALPKEVPVSKLLEQRRPSPEDLLQQMQVAGETADALRSALDAEMTEWARWLDAARALGEVDPSAYGAFLADLRERTDGTVERLLDEAQRGLYERWRDQSLRQSDGP